MVTLEKLRALYEEYRASRNLQQNSIIYTLELRILPDTMGIEFSDCSVKPRTGNSSGVFDVSIFITPGIAEIVVSVFSIH